MNKLKYIFCFLILLSLKSFDFAYCMEEEDAPSTQTNPFLLDNKIVKLFVEGAELQIKNLPDNEVARKRIIMNLKRTIEELLKSNSPYQDRLTILKEQLTIAFREICAKSNLEFLLSKGIEIKATKPSLLNNRTIEFFLEKAELQIGSLPNDEVARGRIIVPLKCATEKLLELNSPYQDRLTILKKQLTIAIREINARRNG